MKPLGRYSFAFGAGDTTVSQTITGLMAQFMTNMAIVAIPNWTNAETLTYSHVLDTTAPIYTIAGLTETQPITAPVVLLYQRPIYNGCVIKLTLSGVPGGTGGTVTVDLYVEY